MPKVRVLNLLFAFLLFAAAFLLLRKTYFYFELDNPKWSLCISDRNRRWNASFCHPLYYKILPGTYEQYQFKGKLMQNTLRPRNKSKFLLLPSVNDKTTEIPHCQKAGHIKWTLVNCIKSSASNFDRRHVIRNTWGTVEVFDGLQLRNIFIVGTTEDKKVQRKISEEAKMYFDILQVDIQDSPKTVPEKVLAGMQWAAEYLQPKTLYSSMDDDIVIHVPNLTKYLQKSFLDLKTCQLNSLQNYRPCYEDLPILCVYSYQSKDSPTRLWFSKWYISYHDFPQSLWPKYCRGGMYVMPVHMTKQLYDVSRFTEYLYLDDVWITGFMRRKLGLGDLNIVPAPHSVRSDFSLRAEQSDVKNLLLEHLWGDMKDGVDIPGLGTRVWQEWKPDLPLEKTCLASKPVLLET